MKEDTINTHSIEEVSALAKLWPQRVTSPMDPVVQGEGLRQEVVSLCDVVEHVVGVNGSVHVPPQDLESGPEGKEGVHVGTRHTSGRVHVDIHQSRAISNVLHNGPIVLEKREEHTDNGRKKN